MPKGSLELTNARKEEIINACEELYKTMSFKEITIKEIGNITSFTRTSIYNYFQTKEEIFSGGDKPSLLFFRTAAYCPVICS